MSGEVLVNEPGYPTEGEDVLARMAAFGLAVFLVAASLLTGSGSAVAQSIFAGGTIEEIRIEGSQRIEPASVRSYMGLNPGDTFNAVELDRGLKALFDTGLFADVTFRREGSTLVVSIVENPIINRLAFEGNKRIDDEVLQSETELRSRIVYTRTKVQNDVKRILDLYRRSGRFAAVVEPKVIQLSRIVSIWYSRSTRARQRKSNRSTSSATGNSPMAPCAGRS